MFFKYFRQYRQNGNWMIIIDFFRGSIFVKGCYFCFFPFSTWKKGVTNTVVTYESYFVSYEWSGKFKQTWPNYVCTCCFIDVYISEKLYLFELVELKTLYLQESLLGRILLVYRCLHLLQVPSILMQC